MNNDIKVKLSKEEIKKLKESKQKAIDKNKIILK
jgi:hypothetical protein